MMVIGYEKWYSLANWRDVASCCHFCFLQSCVKDVVLGSWPIWVIVVYEKVIKALHFSGCAESFTVSAAFFPDFSVKFTPERWGKSLTMLLKLISYVFWLPNHGKNIDFEKFGMNTNNICIFVLFLAVFRIKSM